MNNIRSILRCSGGSLRCTKYFSSQQNNDHVVQGQIESAKTFKDVPKISGLTMFRRFLPGGQFAGISLNEMYKALHLEFGDILKFPDMFGKSGMLCIFKPEDFEKVFRNEDQYPYRRDIETLTYYRNVLRPDLYKEFGSVFTDQGERWYKTRKIMNQIMMKPENIKMYIPTVDQISIEFIQK